MTPYRDLTMHKAVDLFIRDYRAEGRINSIHTERAYRGKLNAHAEDMGNRSPADTARADVKTTLRRWEGNTQGHAHAILSSFYRWCVEEDIRPSNPVHAVRAPRAQPMSVYKMTQAEVLALLWAARTDQRDHWAARLGVCAGLRASEMLGLQGRHMARRGWVWVSSDIAKGKRERWVPVIADLEEVAEEIRSEVRETEFVLPPRRWVGPANGRDGFYEGFVRRRRLSYPALHKSIVKLGERAAVAGRVTPHTLRHAFGEYVARSAGLRVAQVLMGHANVQTTVGYTDTPSLDEIADSVRGLELGVRARPGSR